MNPAHKYPWNGGGRWRGGGGGVGGVLKPLWDIVLRPHCSVYLNKLWLKKSRNTIRITETDKEREIQTIESWFYKCLRLLSVSKNK